MGALLLICAALTLSAFAAGSAGTDKDPLVTLSYLNDTFMNTIMEKVDGKIAERDKKLSEQGIGGESLSFAVVDLAPGQTLQADLGCEVLLRVGSAVCVSSSAPGLIDETDGTALQGGGALVKNHLYMATIEGRGVKAGGNAVKLLVRGSYSIA